MNQLTLLESFDLPEVLAARLPLLDSLIYHRDEALSNGFTYDGLIQEMDEALATMDSEAIRSGFGISGRCWIHPQAKIKDNVIIEGPCIVCKGAEVGPKVYLGAGTVVGPYAKLGLGVTATATIIGARSKIKYETSIANTVIGECADISETVAVASARQHPPPVASWTTSGQPLQTSLPKLGAHIGTQTHIGTKSLIMPGSVIHDEVTVRNSVVNGYLTPLDATDKAPGGLRDRGRGPVLTSRTIALATLLLLAALLGGSLIREAFLMSPSGAPSGAPDSTAAAAAESAPAVEGGPTQIPGPTEPLPPIEAPITPVVEADFTIQVAAFREYPDAESLSNLLQDYGHPSYVVEAEIPDAGHYYRVRVGQFGTADEAWDDGLFLEAQFSDVIPDPWIVPYQQ